MSQANSGDTVTVHYTGKLTDGTVFDSSVEREPLQFTIGENQLIPGFEKAVVGMTEGDSKSVTLKPDEAYGEHNSQLVWEVDKSELPDEIEPEVGQQLQSVQNDGRRINLVVSEVLESSVKLDANHPLAGQELVFDIELLKID